MNLAEALIARHPRETSGARTSSRYHFQQNWALCKLLDLYSNDSEFLMLLDYHEDIVILDHESSPEKADFFQIKTKDSGAWTIAQLAKKKIGKDGVLLQSMLEKLYSAHRLCGENARKLCFVSNQAVKLQLNNGKATKEEVNECSFLAMALSEKECIHKCIEGNNSSVSDFVGLNKITTYRTSLSLDDHETHTKGHLVKFFENLYPNKPIQTTAIYRALLDEIRQKTNDDKVYLDFSSLTKYKGISRSFFHKIISLAGEPSAKALWDTAEKYLVNEETPVLALNQLKTKFFEYALSRMDPLNEDIQKLSSSIRDRINVCYEIWKCQGLLTIIGKIHALISSQSIARNYDSNFIKAAAIYEVLGEAVQETHPEPSETPI